ncbi:MAG: hypothetical protein HUK21_12815 [Fibrobacteraceae bacterium]|nr:hypothetical protein [Fibrobacteraceae bacterium]
MLPYSIGFFACAFSIALDIVQYAGVFGFWIDEKPYISIMAGLFELIVFACLFFVVKRLRNTNLTVWLSFALVTMFVVYILNVLLMANPDSFFNGFLNKNHYILGYEAYHVMLLIFAFKVFFVERGYLRLFCGAYILFSIAIFGSLVSPAFNLVSMPFSIVSEAALLMKFREELKKNLA